MSQKLDMPADFIVGWAKNSGHNPTPVQLTKVPPIHGEDTADYKARLVMSDKNVASKCRAAFRQAEARKRKAEKASTSDADLSIEAIRMLIALEVRRAVVDELRKFLNAPAIERPAPEPKPKVAKNPIRKVTKYVPSKIATDPYMRRFQLCAYRLRNRGMSWWQIGESIGAGAFGMTPDSHVLDLAKYCNGPFDKAYTSRIEELERKANATK
jgi:hypothetical protein